MLDAAAEPPEINSALVHNAPGPVSTSAAATAYAAAAVEDQAHAATLMGIVAAVQAAWNGVASSSAAGQLMRLIAWFEALAAASAATALQLESIAAAVTGAQLLSPVPVQVHVNRITTAILWATNFMGVNSPEIAVQDARYVEYWIRAATARASSDLEATLASGTLLPWPPPPPPVNLASIGSAAAHGMATMGKVATAPAFAADFVAREASWDMMLAGGAAGDVAGVAGDVRPSGALMADAAQTAERDARVAAGDGEQLARAGSAPERLAAQPDQAMQGLAQQGSSLMSSATQPLSQMGSQLGSVGQIGQAPMRMLQPLMSALGQSTTSSPDAAAASMGANSFGMGAGSLSASMTGPAGGVGGGVQAAGAGLRLPASAMTASVQPVSPASASAVKAVGTPAVASAGGSGMYGAPAHAAHSRGGDSGSANKYAQTHDLAAVGRGLGEVSATAAGR